MSLFDDVVVNAKSAASAVGKKAEQIVDLSKLKYAAAGLCSEISKKKEALGDYVFESSKTGNLDHDIMKEKIQELADLEDNYQATQKMIIAAKNKKICKQCGGENEKSASFCSKCGARLEMDEEKPQNVETSVNDMAFDVEDEAKSKDDDFCCTKAAEEIKDDIAGKAVDLKENIGEVFDEVEETAKDIKNDAKDFFDKEFDN